MANIQAMFPVYLPRRMENGEDQQKYDTNISQNENNLMQNFNILYNKLVELEDRLNGG